MVSVENVAQLARLDRDASSQDARSCDSADPLTTLSSRRFELWCQATARAGPRDVRAPSVSVRSAPSRAVPTALSRASRQDPADGNFLGSYARMVCLPPCNLDWIARDRVHTTGVLMGHAPRSGVCVGHDLARHGRRARQVVRPAHRVARLSGLRGGCCLLARRAAAQKILSSVTEGRSSTKEKSVRTSER